jgi:hypothetical protein
MTELLDEARGEGKGLFLVAGVPVHLAAAGLSGGKVDGVTEAFEDADDGFSGLGKQGVVVAGDKERDSQNQTLRAAAKIQ